MWKIVRRGRARVEPAYGLQRAPRNGPGDTASARQRQRHRCIASWRGGGRTGSATGECETRASSSAPICSAASATSSRASPAAKFRSSACGGAVRLPLARFRYLLHSMLQSCCLLGLVARQPSRPAELSSTPGLRAACHVQALHVRAITCRAAYALT